MTSNLSRSRKARVLYGTETGTSQDLAEEIGQILQRQRFQHYVQGLDNVSPSSLSDYALTVVVISTTGQGDFPSNTKRFWTSLLRKKLKSDYLADVQYALIGLGDSSYPKFCWAARKLDKRLKQLGATEVLAPCEADEQGEDSTEGAFLSWCQEFKQILAKIFPLPEGQVSIPDDIPLPSGRRLELVSEHSGEQQHENPDSAIELHLPSSEPSIDRRSIPGTYPALLETNVRVTPTDHWQDVRHLVLSLETSLPYLPGDAVSIYPKNFDEDVNSLILLMGWDEIADKALRLNIAPFASIDPPSLSSLTLRALLTTYLDITAIPKRSFFAKISHHTTDSMHKERLLEFNSAQYLDEYYDYATRPRRSILEVLAEFDTVKIPYQEVLNIIPVLRPRQFSVASGGSLKRNTKGTTRFDLLVAVVKYRTVIKKIRQGVCTRYLAALAPGSRLNISIRTDGRLHAHPQDFLSSHILIGAGTGIAPLRSLIHEKEFILRKLSSQNTAIRSVSTTSTTTLIFGSRNKAADFFFADEWTQRSSEIALSSSSASSQSAQTQTHQPFLLPLNLITAFSRDQAQKSYIQHQISSAAHSQNLFQQIYHEDATVVVCGSSGNMPKAVRVALVEILKKGLSSMRVEGEGGGEGNRGGLMGDRGEEGERWEKEAELYLEGMEKKGRFKQETW